MKCVHNLMLTKMPDCETSVLIIIPYSINFDK